MNPEETLTPEQKENLKTWAEQRDSILSEISILKTEGENLQKINAGLTDSNTEIENRIVETRGRIEELKIKEEELSLLTAKEVSSLQTQKNTLESEITLLSKTVVELTSQKASLEKDVSLVLKTFNTVKGETIMLDKVVERVTVVSEENLARINLLVENLATSLAEIITVNKKNVEETNIVIEKLPKMIMEAQKHGLIKTKI